MMLRLTYNVKQKLSFGALVSGDQRETIILGRETLMAVDTQEIENLTVTGAEAAEILGIAKSTAASWVKQGKLSGELRGAGQNRRFEIPLEEVYREKHRREIRSETLKAEAQDFLWEFYSSIERVIEAAEHLKSLRNDEFDWGEEDHDPGDAIKHFKQLDEAFLDLLDRVLAAQSVRGRIRVLDHYMKATGDGG